MPACTGPRVSPTWLVWPGVQSSQEKSGCAVNRPAGGRRISLVGGTWVSVTDAEDRSAAEEAELVAQIAAGDAGAPVTELYHRYGRRLFRFGMQALGNEGLAEEMVQECFVRLWR